MIILSHETQAFKVVTTFPEVVTIPRICEEFTCQICGNRHNVLYVITRKDGKQFGHFMAFSIAEKWQVVDPTLPHDVDKLPTDAIRVPDDIASFSWHGTGHYFYLRDGEGHALSHRDLMVIVEGRKAGKVENVRG